MKLAVALVAMSIASLGVSAGALVSQAQAEAPVGFVGTTPCETVRTFLGGLDRSAACHSVAWKLTLDAPRSGPSTWSVTAAYGIPSPADPNQVIDGPRVSVKGVYQIAPGGRGAAKTYRLALAGPDRSLSFVQVGDNLLHVLTPDGALMLGTAGWSYTLNRADRLEPPATPAPSPEMSYPISPRATGGDVFGIFEGRTACTGIARQLRISAPAGCFKVKWRMTLYWNASASQPTTYKIEGTFYRREARTGTWQMLRGAAIDSNAVVYQLDPTATEGPLLLLKGDERVLFMLDDQRRPLVGNADFGYTLNRAAN